jgi:hypothetical protein
LGAKNFFEAKRARGVAVQQKGVESAHHVKVAEEFGGCAGFDAIEILSELINANKIFREA